MSRYYSDDDLQKIMRDANELAAKDIANRAERERECAERKQQFMEEKEMLLAKNYNERFAYLDELKNK